MANLDFTKVGNKYEAQITVNGDFNLHIEKNVAGYIHVYQRTSEVGEFDSIKGLAISPSDKVVDLDFVGAIYPKEIKVVSAVEPVLAVVTFNA